MDEVLRAGEKVRSPTKTLMSYAILTNENLITG